MRGANVGSETMRRLVCTVFAALWLGLPPLAAFAYEAFAAKDVHLRAGPARDYPVVAILPPGTLLDVQGCLPDYSWCDVIALGERGWIYAANIESVYQGTPVPLIDYGPVFGIAVFGFVLGDYWDHHYHGRPWFRDRDDWIRRPRPPQPPIPPRPRPRPPEFVPPPRPVHPPVVVPRARPEPPVHREPPPVHREPPAHPPTPHREPPQHVPPPRSAEPGRPPTVRN
jgi:uncharacterized protein YraI